MYHVLLQYIDRVLYSCSFMSGTSTAPVGRVRNQSNHVLASRTLLFVINDRDRAVAPLEQRFDARHKSDGNVRWGKDSDL